MSLSHETVRGDTSVARSGRRRRSRRRLGVLAVGVITIVATGWFVAGRAARQSEIPPGSMAMPPVRSVAAAREAMGRGAVTAAEEMLQDVLRRDPLNVEARTELQWLYFHEFRTRDVERLLEAALERAPHDLEPLMHLIVSEFRGPVPQEGLGRLQSIDALQPGQLCIQRALAICEMRLGHAEEARRHVNAVLAQDPGDLESLLTAAEFCLMESETSSAQEIALRLRPMLASNATDDDRAWWVLSEVARLEGDTSGALENLDKALERRPFELPYHQRRGLLLKALQREEEAVAELERAQELADCQMRLTEIAWSGELTDPSAAVCAEVAELCEVRGKRLQAESWRYWRDVLRRSAEAAK